MLPHVPHRRVVIELDEAARAVGLAVPVLGIVRVHTEEVEDRIDDGSTLRFRHESFDFDVPVLVEERAIGVAEDGHVGGSALLRVNVEDLRGEDGRASTHLQPCAA